MRRRKSRVKPSKILTKALLLGLASTIYLAKARVTEETRHLYEGGRDCKGMKRIHEEALEEYYRLKRERRPSADPLQRREGSIVRSFQKITFNTSVPYGNTEVTRKRRKEDRKFINSLSDYYGAGLRNLGAEKFLFTLPMKTHTDKGKTTWVYPGNASTPEYSPTHTAPELDFVDIIRSHGTELIRQCMKYSVPIGDARRYLDTLIVRLTPYLEAVYTGQRKIVDGFVRGCAKVLRGLTLEIRAIYGGVTGRRQSITEEVFERIESQERESSQNSDGDDKKDFLDSFFSHLADRCDVNSNPSWRKKVRKLRTLIRKKILNRADAEHIESDLLEHARQLGSSFHDFISNSEFTVRPFSLFGVYRFGDEMVNEPAEFLFTCEVYVADGRGRADLLLFRRKRLQRVDDSLPEYVWEPCMLVEIKTRCFFDLDLYATTTKSKDEDRRVIEHIHDLRKSTTDEWREVIDSTPTSYEREQLYAYEKEVLEEYRKLNRQDTDPPKSLKKAVLVVDLKENWETLRDNSKELVLAAHQSSESATLSKRQHFVFSPKNKKLRMGLVVFSDTEKKTTNPVKAVTHFDPFSKSEERKNDRRFTLYLTVSGKGSPAESAALIAARWHGLELIYDRTKGDSRNIIWFDLSGDLDDWKKRKRVFRYSLHSKTMRHLLKRNIRFIDLSEVVTLYLQGRKDSRRMRDEVLELIKGIEDPFIVFTGSDRIRKTLIKKRTPLYDELVALMLDSVPHTSSVMWFDRPVPVSHTSQRYDTRSVAPFYNDSVWMNLIDEVIYNVPTAPIRYGSFVPVEDDLRWMVVECAEDMYITQMLVPPLYKWGERFRPDRNRDENIPRQNMHFLRSSYSKTRSMHVGTCEEIDERAILELIPHLRRFYDLDMSSGEEDEDTPIRNEWLLSEPSESKPFLERVNYTPYQHLTEKKKGSRQSKDGRVTRLEQLEKINHRREYRTTRLYGRPRKVTTRPPHTSLLKYRTQDLNSLYLKELSGIRRVLKTLRKRQGEELQGLLDSLDGLVNREKTKRVPENVLRAVRAVLETHPLTKRVWDHLRVIRSRIPQGLSPEQEKILKQLADRHPDILMIMGNQLFLMLYVAVHEVGAPDVVGNVIETLWEYLIPWQLIGLGYEPEYPEHIPTGRSVMHRSQLIDRLFRRVKVLKDIRVGEEAHTLQFGQAALIEEKGISSLFLTFQTRPESRNMNTIFLRLPTGTKGQTIDVLRRLCRERPFWGESDPTRLGRLSDTVNLDECVDILVATQKGVQGLWVFDETGQRWNVIGRLNYYTRRRETVTLLMSVTLREESTLEDLLDERVRGKPSDLRSTIEVGLGTVSAVFRNCETVKCRLSLDDEERMFRLSFHRQEGSSQIAHLLIKRTVDVIEVLRRPDFQCEQVVVDGHEMVWNRFRDIEYVRDMNLVKPWVERREPFKTVDLNFPKTADQFIKVQRREGLKLTVRHDPRTCPLCTVSKDELRKRSEKHTGVDVSEYLRWIDGENGQPEELMNWSIYRHGVCWRVELEDEEELPDVVKTLENIALSGPALATLLESGSISYESERDRWVLLEFTIPESEELPREFRESIYLMRWRREGAVMPGQYILEEWVSDISVGIDKILLSLESQVTGEKQTHSVYAKRGDQMHPERLAELLEQEMQMLVRRVGLEDDEHLRGLIRDLIVDVTELVEESRPASLKYEKLGVISLGYSGNVLEAIFTSSDGEMICIQVSQAIHVYLNWMEFSGGVGSDVIETDVATVLSQYGISEKVIDEVIGDVMAELEDQGVVFWEEG